MSKIRGKQDNKPKTQERNLEEKITKKLKKLSTNERKII